MTTEELKAWAKTLTYSPWEHERLTGEAVLVFIVEKEAVEVREKALRGALEDEEEKEIKRKTSCSSCLGGGRRGKMRLGAWGRHAPGCKRMTALVGGNALR